MEIFRLENTLTTQENTFRFESIPSLLGIGEFGWPFIVR